MEICVNISIFSHFVITILSNTLNLPYRSFKHSSCDVTIITSHIEYLIQTYNIPVLSL